MFTGFCSLVLDRACTLALLALFGFHTLALYGTVYALVGFSTRALYAVIGSSPLPCVLTWTYVHLLLPQSADQSESTIAWGILFVSRLPVGPAGGV